MQRYKKYKKADETALGRIAPYMGHIRPLARPIPAVCGLLATLYGHYPDLC